RQIDRAIKDQVSPDALVPPPVLARRTQARRALEFAGPFEENALRKARDAAEAEAGSYPDPTVFALELAERMEQARRARSTWASIPPLTQYGDPTSRKAIAGQIGKIALILRNFLPDRAKDVRTIIVIFGSGNQATRETVELPRIVESVASMYLHEPQLSRFPNWLGQPPVYLGDGPKRKPVVDQIQYIDAEVTRVKQDGRLSMSF